jgi:type IV secretory pathway VirB4 component
MAGLPDSKIKNGYREIRTVLVIDEAHNYLSQKNPFLEKIVREGRSKGIAVFFASQSPSDYDQPSFDFRELLEFSFIFQCDGVSAKSVQDLLACTQKTAKELQTEIAKQKVFFAISKSLVESEEVTRLKILPFYEALNKGDYSQS